MWFSMMRSRIMAIPKDRHVLLPRTCECVILHGKEEFWLQMELMLLIQMTSKGGDYPGSLKVEERGLREVRVRERWEDAVL